MLEIGVLLREATARLVAAGVPSPRVDAEVLLAHHLGVARSRLALIDTVADPAGYTTLVARRADREPLQHITGHAPFRHLDLAVGPGVFVPRPETELLVDAVLPLPAGAVAVDLCAGSGALAIAVATEAPGTTAIAVEKSPAALPWLRRNADGTGVEVVEADVSTPLLAGVRADVVVSNPPYVPRHVDVDPEVAADPDDAVFADDDGLAVIRDVIARAAELLRPGGVFAMEHDDTQGESVPALLAADGHWTDIADHRDLAGRPRYVTARRAR